MADADILRAVAVCAELTGTELSEAAARIFADDLSAYPKPAVLRALERCRREVRGRLVLADVLERVVEQDGRLSADEAWALCTFDEAASVVWTDEIAAAWGVAYPLRDDVTAARMAFRKAYEREVAEARREGVPVKWRPSLGTDASGREAALRQAVELGRLTRARAVSLLPRLADDLPDDDGIKLIEDATCNVMKRIA